MTKQEEITALREKRDDIYHDCFDMAHEGEGGNHKSYLRCRCCQSKTPFIGGTAVTTDIVHKSGCTTYRRLEDISRRLTDLI